MNPIHKFKLPDTKLCIVVWYRDGKKNEQLLDTPANNKILREVMLKHRVGWSEIRAIKSVEASGLIGQCGW
jgi:hypothetical protein